MNALISEFDFINNHVINLLEKRGIYTVNDFLRSDSRFIERISSLTYLEISEVKKYITKSFSATPLNAFKYYQRILSHSVLIPTGILELDDLLQGGLFTGTIYEICSPPSNDKTLFILLILNKILSDSGIFFLDTKQEFSGKYLKALLSKDKNQEDCLQLMNKILVKQISTKYDLIRALFDIKQDLKNGSSVRIIIIHYLPVLFLDTNNNTENNIMNHLANVLRYIAHVHHVVIIITNLITTWNDGDFRFSSGIKEKVACGKYWLSIPNVRLGLNRKEENILQISLLKHDNVTNIRQCFIDLNKIV